jgi:hypothetical protein
MNTRHPSETDLALLAGGDCGRLQRFRLDRHVAKCGDCRDTLESFGELRSAVRDYSPPGLVSSELDWERAAAEMRANIRVGLAAGECVRELPARGSRWGWKPQLAIGIASGLLLGGIGIFLHGLLPHENSPGVVHAAVLESTGAGVEVRTDKGSMTLLNHSDQAGDQTVTSQGAIRASSFDGTTGTVTITSVYVE